ncbi:hypothetical protein D3C75_1190160 [compost metagenome]
MHIHKVARRTRDDDAYIRICQVGFEAGSDLVGNRCDVQPGHIDSACQGEGDAAIG